MKRWLTFLIFPAALLLSAAGADEHRRAASEMMRAGGVPEMLRCAFSAQLENQIKALPELEKIRPQLEKFYREAFAFEELESELCVLYMKHYTVEEMRQISAFYRTPAGKKKALIDVKLSSELGTLFLKHSQKKMPELQKLLRQLSKKE